MTSPSSRRPSPSCPCPCATVKVERGTRRSTQKVDVDGRLRRVHARARPLKWRGGREAISRLRGRAAHGPRIASARPVAGGPQRQILSGCCADIVHVGTSCKAIVPILSGWCLIARDVCAAAPIASHVLFTVLCAAPPASREAHQATGVLCEHTKDKKAHWCGAITNGAACRRGAIKAH